MAKGKWKEGLGSPRFAADRARDIVDLFYRRGFAPAPGMAEAASAVLIRYGEEQAVLTESDVADLAAACQRLYQLFAETNTDRAVALLNQWLGEAAEVVRLSNHDRTPWHLHLTSDNAPWGTWLVSSSAWALAVLLAAGQHNPAGVCTAAGCGRPILLGGRGPTRQYCSSQCASRARVARYRLRHPLGPENNTSP